jgi:hypothetical protein
MKVIHHNTLPRYISIIFWTKTTNINLFVSLYLSIYLSLFSFFTFFIFYTFFYKCKTIIFYTLHFKITHIKTLDIVFNKMENLISVNISQLVGKLYFFLTNSRTLHVIYKVLKFKLWYFHSEIWIQIDAIMSINYWLNYAYNIHIYHSNN